MVTISTLHKWIKNNNNKIPQVISCFYMHLHAFIFLSLCCWYTWITPLRDNKIFYIIICFSPQVWQGYNGGTEASSCSKKKSMQSFGESLKFPSSIFCGLKYVFCDARKKVVRFLSGCILLPFSHLLLLTATLLVERRMLLLLVYRKERFPCVEMSVIL